MSVGKATAANIGDIGLRVLAAIAGGYAVTYALTAALSVGLVKGLGASRVDAAIVSTNLALLIYPVVSIWAFSARRLWLVVGAPVAASLVLGAIAWVVRL